MTWVIGDLQGCFGAFTKLLKEIDFDASRNRLWLVGDLVNRGEDSLKTLEFVYKYRDSIQIVLGNHDISLISAYYGIKKSNPSFEPILKSKNAKELIDWLKSQPFFHVDDELGYCMSHAGISPYFDTKIAIGWNKILQSRLQSNDVASWLKTVTKNKSAILEYGKDDDELYALASFIRMRYCIDDGMLELEEKGGEPISKSLKPWFQIKNRKDIQYKIIFGHWSTLGLYQDENVIGLDSGCVWGGKLTAYCLESSEIRAVECRG